MAAPAKKMVGASDSSSSDDEELRRCQEAVWETKTNRNKDSDVKESKRVVVADHEHDGNELQVTQGFRTHVAKKLGHFLDSCIVELRPEASSCVESAKCSDDDDEGFRLFSTSVPGQKAEDAPAPARRRPVQSSSDSDSEMEKRLKEAAVSVKDLLPSSMLPSTLSPQSTELPCSEKIKKKKKKKKVAEEEESHAIVKKKKREQNQEGSEQVDSAANAQSNGEHKNSEPEHTQAKVKRKKKKRREGNTEEALN
ncbi:uncharacterized protein C12orf43 homolog isoform X2 [Stegastes partitus]|uniref:Protein CUSTOS n=1 Tax=Stegastes partitus TaxID=144197 RepID=A0A9Y4TVT8_9TELE|nr:PREDICTED: uncharacterized protein C12orf43 homolog isoform X2 [Stegastes partitus]